MDAPLLNAVSANLRKIRRRRAARQDAIRMIGEAGFDPKAHQRNLGKLQSASSLIDDPDAAVVFYPGLEQGIPVSGDSVEGILTTFFREVLPEIYPEAKAVSDEMKVSEMTNLALSHGMSVIFGRDGKINQVMSKQLDSAKKSLKSVIVDQVFDDGQDDLITWLNAYGSVKDSVPSKSLGLSD